MGNGDDLATDEIVETVQGIRENEAIANPNAGFDRFANFGNVVKSALVAVLNLVLSFSVKFLVAYLIGLALELGVVAQHVETVLGAQRHHVVVFTPVNLQIKFKFLCKF